MPGDVITLDFPGVVSAEQAFRLARRHHGYPTGKPPAPWEGRTYWVKGYPLSDLPPEWHRQLDEQAPEGYVLNGVVGGMAVYITPVGRKLLERAEVASTEARRLYKDSPWLAAIRRNDAMTLRAWAGEMTIEWSIW